MNKILEKLSAPRRSTRDLSFTILGTLILSLLFTLINANFINKFNLISMGQNLAPYAILALGVLMPISMGGTDLSIGAVCIGSAVVAGKLYSLGLPLIMTIPVMIAFGTLIGFINGYLIAKKHLQPFIVTLGTMMFVRGATALFANSATVLFPSGTWFNHLFSTYNGFPISFLWILLFTCLMFFLYRKTKMGRYFTSIGSSEKATRISGIDVDKYTILGYTGSGLMAGVAAIFWTASFATVTVATGNGMELDAIASVYIGGTSTTGGLANVFGCIVGSIMLVIIRSGLNFSLAKLNIPINSTYVTFVISGIIVVAAVLLEKSKGTSKKHNISSVKKQAIVRLSSYALSVVLVASLVLIGVSGNKGTSSAESKTISLVMKSEGNEFWDSVTEGALAAGEDLDYTVFCRGGESEDASFLPKQREITSTLLSDNPAGLGISTIANGFTDLMEEAYDRGIPVIQYDSGLHQEDLDYLETSAKNPLRAYVKSSDYDNAVLAAEKTYECVRDDIIASEKYVVGVIQFANNVPGENRANGFADRFMELAEADSKTAGKVQVIIEMKPSNANNAYKEALEYLFEKESKLIFATSLLVANQCCDAVTSSNGKYDGVKFVSYDTGEKIAEWLKSDIKSPLLGTISQNPYMIGYLTVKTLVEIHEGKEVETTIKVPAEWVNVNNIDSFN